MSHATTPEAPETIAAQLQWLREGKRQAVLLTPGCVLPELPEGLLLLPTAEGVLVYRMDSAGAVYRYQRAELTLAELLGYGIPAKPVPCPLTPGSEKVIVVRGPTGVEKQSVVTDAKRLDACVTAAHAVKDPNGRAYNRTAHLPERKKMMQQWADYLDKLKTGADIIFLPIAA